MSVCVCQSFIFTCLALSVPGVLQRWFVVGYWSRSACLRPICLGWRVIHGPCPFAAAAAARLAVARMAAPKDERWARRFEECGSSASKYPRSCTKMDCLEKDDVGGTKIIVYVKSITTLVRLFVMTNFRSKHLTIDKENNYNHNFNHNKNEPAALPAGMGIVNELPIALVFCRFESCPESCNEKDKN